jgi:hypothetical protein
VSRDFHVVEAEPLRPTGAFGVAVACDWPTALLSVKQRGHRGWSVPLSVRSTRTPHTAASSLKGLGRGGIVRVALDATLLEGHLPPFRAPSWRRTPRYTETAPMSAAWSMRAVRSSGPCGVSPVGG